MLDWDSLYNEAGAGAMAGGKKRFYDNKVKSIRTSADGGKLVVKAAVGGDRDYSASIIFDEQGGLYDYSCDCAHDLSAAGPCRHIIAAALAYETR